MKFVSVGEVFDSHKGRASGFDYLRLGLALGVIFWHGSVVVFGHEFDRQLATTWIGGLSRIILPMFFALSGFLVAGSLMRTNSLLEYLSFRALRIFPALAVEVVLSAFILGAFVTSLPLVDYFTEGELLRYLGNMAGIIYVYLPGVFVDHPSRWVNISLWTVPYELECYIALFLLAALGVTRRPMLLLLALCALQLILPVLDNINHQDQFSGVNRIVPRTLVLCFLAGVGFYIFRYKVPKSLPLAVAALGLTYFLVSTPGLSYFVSLPVAYATICLGILNPPRAPIIFSGDYSYGMYLYAFPFQQLHMELFPNNTSWVMNMLFAIPVTACFAYFSWTFIEKPILQRRHRLVEIVPKLIPFQRQNR